MRKYADCFVIAIREHMAYPSAVRAKIFSKVIYLYLQFSVWTALFSSHSQVNPLLNREDTLRYIIAAIVLSAFMECNVIEWINARIQTGDIAVEFIRPMDFRIMAFSRYAGDGMVKLVFYCIPAGMFGMAVMGEPLLCHGQILYGLLSVLLAFCIQFLYSLIIGLLAFWLIVTWPLNMLLGAVYKLLSGVWIPVSMFPGFVVRINLFLPFRTIYAIPVTIMTNRMDDANLRGDILTQFIWMAVMFAVSEIVWEMGKRKLIVQGG